GGLLRLLDVRLGHGRGGSLVDLGGLGLGGLLGPFLGGRLRLGLAATPPPAAHTARGRLLEGGTNGFGRVLVTRPALALHLGQDLGLLTVRDGSARVRDRNSHLPEQRDERVGLDPQVFRQFDNLHATALPPLRRCRPARTRARRPPGSARPARRSSPRRRRAARSRPRPPTWRDPPGSPGGSPDRESCFESSAAVCPRRPRP